MRKVVISINITLDGFLAGSKGELDWHFKFWTNDMSRYSTALLASADTLLFGRRTFLQMQAYWDKKLGDKGSPREDEAYADMLFNHRKIVFSNTLKKTTWNNSEACAGDLKTTLLTLKTQPGKKLLTVGSGQLSRSLLYEGIADELILWQHPVLLGKGKMFFERDKYLSVVQLADYKIFSSGVVAAKYRLTEYENDGIEFVKENNETNFKSLPAFRLSS